MFNCFTPNQKTIKYHLIVMFLTILRQYMVHPPFFKCSLLLHVILLVFAKSPTLTLLFVGLSTTCSISTPLSSTHLLHIWNLHYCQKNVIWIIHPWPTSYDFYFSHMDTSPNIFEYSCYLPHIYIIR